MIVAYNSIFDRSMIEQCSAAAAALLPDMHWHCAMRAYAAFRKDPRLPSQGYRWRPLHEAADSFGLTIPTHRALADAMACRGVVLGMAAASRDKVLIDALNELRQAATDERSVFAV